MTAKRRITAIEIDLRHAGTPEDVIERVLIRIDELEDDLQWLIRRDSEFTGLDDVRRCRLGDSGVTAEAEAANTSE